MIKNSIFSIFYRNNTINDGIISIFLHLPYLCLGILLSILIAIGKIPYLITQYFVNESDYYWYCRQ
jgi:hypothetical protein